MIGEERLTMTGAGKHSRPTEKSVRVLICAPSAVRRGGLERLLEGQPGLQVAGSVSYLSDLQTAIRETDPDVIILHQEASSRPMDWDGLIASGVPVVWWANEGVPRNAVPAIFAGAQAILVGNVTGAELAAAVASAAAGLIALSSDLAELVRRGLRAESYEQQDNDTVGPVVGEDGYPEHLTKREREVLEMMADGFSNKEIAAQLSISAHTVKFHISSILGKLGASSRTEAASIGLRRGLITI